MSTLKPDYLQLGQSQKQLQHISCYVGTEMNLSARTESTPISATPC